MNALANPAAAEALVLRHDADGVARLTLNRPAARNALSLALMAEFQSALDAVAEDETVKLVVIAGSGPGFCAGHDLKELRANRDRAFYKQTFTASSALMLTIMRLPKPVIAEVHGIATAAGCQLVATCDLAVAAADARFATPGVNIGLFCSTPMVALGRNVGRKQAMEMLLTGEMIDAKEAQRIGLINRVAPEGGLDTAVAALATVIADKSPLVLKIGKEAFYRQLEMDIDGAYDYAAEVMTRNMLARDAEEGLDAFIEKRAPVWRGE
jgi:enoyl-CoA hydratase/carnithine racemase